MNETGAAARHVVDTVTSDPTVAEFIGDRFYYGAAPEDAPYPFATYFPAGGTNQHTGGSDLRILVQARWRVVVFHDQNDPDLVRRIAGAIDAALVGSSGVVTIDGQAYHVQTVYQEEPFERSGPVDGEFYLNAGGIYRTPVYTIL